MLATSSGDVANSSYLWLYVLIGAATVMGGLWKRVQIADFLKRLGGIGAAKSVVELFEKEVQELRTQRTELLARIEELEHSRTDQQNQIKFLVAQMTGESPIRELSAKIDSMTMKIGEGITAILERVGAE